MYRCCQNPNYIAPLILAIFASYASMSPGQDTAFREPQLPNADLTTNSVRLSQEIAQPGLTPESRQSLILSPRVTDGFVPQAAPETRLTPIIPRPANDQQSSSGQPGENAIDSTVLPRDLSRQNAFRPGIDRDSEGELQPIIPGRTDLRSVIEGIDNWEADQTEKTTDGPEVIRQRYPDGKVQVMRQVSQDESGNFFNHGEWKLFNRQGQTLAEGQFFEGMMDGVWKRWHPQSSGGIFAAKPFNLFRGPYLSVASFNKGNLDGVWILYDDFERKIFEIPYVEGVRQGMATWWYPNAMKMREVTFKDGLLDGSLLEYDEQNKLTRQEEYIEGKKIIQQTTFYRPKQKESENFFLDSKLEPSGQDDWWQARPATLDQVGQRIQHGPALAWYDNGQPKMNGQYKNDVRIGRFIWWHPNGQKQLVGAYDENGNKVGRWTWWHRNGVKSIEGQYENDVPANEWVWWDENGKVISNENLSERAKADRSADTINEGGAEFRDPATDPKDRPSGQPSSQSEDANDNSVLVPPDDLEGLEEIQPYGEGQIDLLPEKLVPDDG